MAQGTQNVLNTVIGGADIYDSPAGQEVQQTANSRGDQRTAQSLPERSELVRLGRSWGAQQKDANQFTLLITIPTTLADLSLQNGEAVGGMSYLIDRVWVKCKTSTASAGSVTILAQIRSARLTWPTRPALRPTAMRSATASTSSRLRETFL